MPFDRYRSHRGRTAPPAILLLGTLLLAAPAGVRAATFTVSGTGDAFNDPTTLRGAIEASKASADAQDTITITATGTITLAPSNGPLGVYNGRNVAGKTLTIAGPGAARLTVSGGGQTGVFSLFDNGTGGVTVAISGLTVSGGANTNGGAGINTNQALSLTGVVLSGNTTVDSVGGGLVDANADVTLTDCTVSGNSAVEGPNAVTTSGGGLYQDGGTLTLTRCTVRDNHSDDFVGGIANYGGTLALTASTVSGNTTGINSGGIENDGTATLTGCTISGNTGNYGGGVYNSGTLTLVGCTFSGNHGQGFGGGLSHQPAPGGSLTVTGCTFSGNSADAGGGAACFITGVAASDSSAATFTGCTFVGNTAQEGGGYYGDSETSGSASGPIAVTFTACTFSGNGASGDFGGGLYVAGVDDVTADASFVTTLTNCTISGNTAPDGGGGLDFYGSVSGGSPGVVRPACVVRSSIVAGNTLTGTPSGTDPDVHQDSQLGISSGGSNLIGVGVGGFTDGANHDQVGTGAAPRDPRLGTLADNGGPVQTFALRAASPALDADYNTPAVADGRGRPRPSGPRGDIGAFEHQAPTAASVSFTTNQGVAKTVSAATLFANASTPDAIGALTAATVSGPAHGTLTFNPDGSFTYTPAAGFTGTDSLTYRINDGVSDSAPATVTATVLAVTAADVAPPVTTATVSPAVPPGGYSRQAVTVTLAATDDASGVAATSYRINGGAETPYTGPFRLSTDGTYTVSYHSVDRAGNVEAAHTLTVGIDTTAPTLTFGTPTPAPNPGGWNNTSVAIPATAADALSGVAGTVTSPIRFTAEGANQTQSVAVTDVVGNSATFRTPAVGIDLTKPVTTAATQGLATGEQVTLSATDALSGVAGIAYAVDGGARTPYTGAFAVTGNGPHTVTYAATDKADNAEATKTLTFTVDIAAPVTTASLAGPLGSGGDYTGPVTVTLSARSQSSTITGTSYRVDGGTPTPYTGPFIVSGDGVHAVTYNSTDAAGNVEAVHTREFTIRPAVSAPAVAHTFPAGLQMFSVPADYGAVPLGTALSQPDPKLAVWDPAMIQYVLSPTAPADALRPGQGYWVRFTQATDLYALGTPTPTDKPFTLSVRKGWNMIGDPFPGAVGLGDVRVQSGDRTYTGLSAAVQAGVVSATLYSYPAGAGAYQTQDGGGSLAPYVGYWLYAFQGCTLEITAP